MSNTAKFKLYMKRFLYATAAYTIAIFAYVFILNRLEDNNLRYLTFLIPIVPTLFALYFHLKALTFQDEFERRVSAEAWTISALVVGALTFTYGFLEQAGLPQFKTFFIFPAMIAVWGLAQPIVRRRYG